MNYVYCLNPLTLFLVLHLRDRGEAVAVITPAESTRRYCRTIGVTCYPLDLYATENLPGLLSGACLLLKTRRYLDRFYQQLSPGKADNFYAVGPLNDYACWYLAKQWSKSGSVYVTNDMDTVEWWPFDPTVSPHLKRHATRIKRARMLVRMVLGLPLTMFDLKAAKLVLGVTEGFLEKHGMTSIDLGSVDDLQAQVISRNSLNLGTFDNLMASGYPPERGWVKPDSLKELYQRLLRIAPDIVIKPHPIVKDYERLEKETTEFLLGFRLLNADMPVELLYPHVKRNVLSVQSSALVAAARMNHLTAICLMDLVEYRDKRKAWKERHKKVLAERSGNRIRFVSNYDELEELLKPAL